MTIYLLEMSDIVCGIQFSTLFPVIKWEIKLTARIPKEPLVKSIQNSIKHSHGTVNNICERNYWRSSVWIPL